MTFLDLIILVRICIANIPMAICQITSKCVKKSQHMAVLTAPNLKNVL